MGRVAVVIQVRFAMGVMMTEISKQAQCVALVEEDPIQVGSEYLIKNINTSNQVVFYLDIFLTITITNCLYKYYLSSK